MKKMNNNHKNNQKKFKMKIMKLITLNYLVDFYKL